MARSLINDVTNSSDIGGVFVNAKNLSTSATTLDTFLTADGSSSLSSVDSSLEFNTTWVSSGERQHNKNAPLLVSDPENPTIIKDAAEELGKLLAKSRFLPTTGHYASNHVMINQERTRRIAAPLKRLRELDEIAREQARKMASARRLFHSTPEELSAKFQRPSRRLGENVGCGESIHDIHKDMMKNRANKNNILDRRYTHMGTASLKGSDGKLYICQVFRG